MSEFIPIGRSFPRRRNRVLKNLARFVFWSFGWKVTGEIPDTPKMVIVGAPHTSHWDVIIGLLASFLLEMRVSWMGKHSIFVWPVARWFKHLGGIPVNRSSPGRVIQDVLNAFESNDQFVLGLSPEGTRKKVFKWKAGFHRIATKANVPIMAAGIDFKKRIVHMGPVFFPTENFIHDCELLKAHFSGYTPRKPANY